MTDTNNTFASLWEEFQELDLSSDQDLIAWLNRVFTIGYQQDEEIPFREEAGIGISWVRQIVPNPECLPSDFSGERHEETKWILMRCIHALIARSAAVEPRQKTYEDLAAITEMWLRTTQG